MEHIQIDIVSDVVCPWCYVGKRRLEKAISSLNGEFEVTVNWHPFQLDPTIGPEGRATREHFANKFGSWERFLEISQHTAAEGAKEGIQFEFEKAELQPNTRKAHLLAKLAEQEGKGREMAERLFKAYFTEGLYIADTDVLLNLATEVGINTTALASKLEDETLLAEISAEVSAYQSLGISSVPSYIINNKYLVQGAQPAEVFVNVLQQLSQDPVANGHGCDDEGCGCHHN